MKVLVISDIHGSSYYAEKIKEIVAREQVLRDSIDRIIADIEGGQDS